MFREGRRARSVWRTPLDLVSAHCCWDTDIDADSFRQRFAPSHSLFCILLDLATSSLGKWNDRTINKRRDLKYIQVMRSHTPTVQGHKVRKWVYERQWSGSDTERNRVTSLAANIIIPRTMLNHLFGLRWPLSGARTLPASMAYFSSAKLRAHLPFKVNPVRAPLCLHDCCYVWLYNILTCRMATRDYLFSSVLSLNWHLLQAFTINHIDRHCISNERGFLDISI